VDVVVLLSFLVPLSFLVALASLGQVGGSAPQLLVTPHAEAVERQARQSAVMRS
jgi:hypothetical protein